MKTAPAAGTSLTSSRGRGGRPARKGEIKKVFNPTGDPMKFMLPVPSHLKVFKAVSTYLVTGMFVSSASSEVQFANSFSIGAINAGELAGYQALFDQFRITKIEAIVMPRVSVVTNASASMGTMGTAVDYDSANNTTLANLLTYSNVLMGSGMIGRYHAWTPTVLMMAGTSGSGTGVEEVIASSPWLNLQVTTTPHYGFKLSWSQTDVVYTADEYVRLHLEFRQKI